MPSDIVIPKGNEAEFIEIASRLDIKKLFFLYDFEEYDEKKSHEINLISGKKISIGIGFIVNYKNFKKAMSKSKLLVARSSDQDRFFIESKKIKMIYGFEGSSRKDFLHQRSSGLNHIMCELARKNGIYIGFSYSQILNNEVSSSVLLGRMSQNIRLCQKYKVKTIIGSFAENPFNLRASHDVSNLFRLSGMNEQNIKSSFSCNF